MVGLWGSVRMAASVDGCRLRRRSPQGFSSHTAIPMASVGLFASERTLSRSPRRLISALFGATNSQRPLALEGSDIGAALVTPQGIWPPDGHFHSSLRGTSCWIVPVLAAS